MNRTEPIAETEPDTSAEHALRRLAEQALDLFVVAEFPSLRFLSITDEGRRLLQMEPAADLRRCSWMDLGAPDFSAALVDEIGPAALAGHDWAGETTLHTAAGGSWPVRAFVTGLPGSGGLPDRLAIAAIDTSAAREIRASLQTEQMLLRALMEHVPDSVYFKDLGSRFIRASHALACKKALKSADEFVGKTDFDFFTEEHARQAFDDEQRIIATGEGISGKEEKETWTDGRVTWVDTCKLPLHDRRGRIIGTFGISRDITERKQAEEKVKATQKELLAASRLAGMAEIATGVLHNIGNALTSVSTSASLLLDQCAASRLPSLSRATQLLESSGDIATFLSADPRGKELPGFLVQLADVLAREREAMMKELDHLRLSVEHMCAVVATQQNYAGGSSLVEDCQPAELVEESLHISAISLARHGIAVVRDFKPAPTVSVARHKVLQILVNLVRNARDAMDDTGQSEKPMTISVESMDGDRVRIVVRDTGVGIPPENLTKIFHFGFTTRKEGHGFGLHASANAATELGGKLFAHSDGPGKGAVFTLELPVKRAPRPDTAPPDWQDAVDESSDDVRAGPVAFGLADTGG
jgi:PAS domain S-box-containing protein